MVAYMGIRLVTAAKMAGYQDLSEFECAVIVYTSEILHSISEVVMHWRFFHMTISRVHREYRESGISSNH